MKALRFGAGKAPADDIGYRELAARVRQLNEQTDVLRQRAAAAAEELARRDDAVRAKLASGATPSVEALTGPAEARAELDAAVRVLSTHTAEVAKLAEQLAMMERGILAERVATDAEALRRSAREFDAALTKAGDLARKMAAISASIDAQLGTLSMSDVFQILGMSADSLRLADDLRELTDPPEWGGRWSAWRQRAAALGLLDAPARKTQVPDLTTGQIQQAGRNVASAAILRQAE